MLNTYVYIDGFNLYYGIKKHFEQFDYRTRQLTTFPVLGVKWLDIEKLLSSLLTPQYRINAINYFASQVISTDLVKKAQLERQMLYWRALKTNPKIRIIEGNFRTSSIFGVAETPCPNCGKFNNRPQKFQKYEEKGTDVNIATAIVRDAFLADKKCDCVILMSDDTDLISPIECVRHLLGKKVIHISAQKNNHRARKIKELAHYSTSFSIQQLKDSQYPDMLNDDNGVFRKPVEW